MQPAPTPRDIPPVWQIVAIVTMIALHTYLPMYQWVTSSWRYLGWLVIAVALALLLSSFRRFRVAGTNVRPFSPVNALVVVGAYRWTRNPMYLGLFVMTLGVAICLGSVSPLVVPPLLFVLLDRRFVRREEQFLRQSLGTAYDEYCQRVRRWF